MGHLYQQALKVEDVKWKTKTPFASIRKIVQNDKYFFRIRPGLWVLNEYKDLIPFIDVAIEESSKKNTDRFDHYYYQGLLVEIGNLKNFDTFIPHQDKNKKFLDKPLKELSTLSEIFPFGFERFVDIAGRIDVSWFNRRKMPDTFIEVEHSTNIVNSLIKFTELQDFGSKFWVVAPAARRREFDSKLSRIAFDSIKSRVKFLPY